MRNPGGVPSERHRHHRHGDNARRGCGTSASWCECHCRFWLRSRRASRFISPAGGGSLTGTLSLVPQVVDVVDVPVIAAGGIGDARGVIAALALGAEAVQMGTVFLSCEESGASRLHRETLQRRNAGHTALTKRFTGRLARAIRNRLMENLNRRGTEILPYPLQRELVRNLAIAAEAAGRADLVPMWAGQSANLSKCTDVLAFLSSLVEEVSEIAGPVIQWTANRSGRARKPDKQK